MHDFSGEVQNDLRGGAHLPTKSGNDNEHNELESFMLFHTLQVKH